MDTLMKRILLLSALVFTLSSGVAFAQADINDTTLNGAVTATQNFVVLTSATGVVANTVLYVDGEFMTVNSSYSSGTRIPVTRSNNPSSHLTSAQVYVVPPGARIGMRLVGSCVRGGSAQGEQYVLVFNMSNGDIGRCAGTLGSRTWRWTNAYDPGTPSASPPETP
jgi:hypothetical protein